MLTAEKMDESYVSGNRDTKLQNKQYKYFTFE